jgi:ribosomal protein L29
MIAPDAEFVYMTDEEIEEAIDELKAALRRSAEPK